MNNDQYEDLLNQYRRGCVFCAPHSSLVWGRTENFGVCFDVAPLAAGHLIIHSAEHYGCAGELPAEHFRELESARTAVKSRIREVWGAVSLYEHGRAGHCLSDGPEHRLCHHFHLHCIPGDSRKVSEELLQRFERVPLLNYSDIPDTYADHGNYLYLETDDGEKNYLVVGEEIERHLLRTLISTHAGYPERANWREHADRSLLKEGMAALGEPPFSLRADTVMSTATEGDH